MLASLYLQGECTYRCMDEKAEEEEEEDDDEEEEEVEEEREVENEEDRMRIFNIGWVLVLKHPPARKMMPWMARVAFGPKRAVAASTTVKNRTAVDVHGHLTVKAQVEFESKV